MGVATGLVSLLLSWLGNIVDLAASTPTSVAADERRLNVRIRHDAADTDSEPAPVHQADTVRMRQDQSLAEVVRSQETTSVSSRYPPPDNPPAVDWQQMIVETTATLRNENLAQETLRSSMWRQTHSTMFQPAGQIVFEEQEPVLPDFQFKPQVHVAGIGFTVGSCFIGLPLVGVPVEERTVAIRLFVCASDAS